MTSTPASRFRARYDSRDAASFATEGMSAEIEYFISDDSLGADRDWQRLEGGARKAIAFGKNLMWLSLAGGADLGDDFPGDRAFSLGGPRTLAGYQYDEVRVDSYWIAEGSFLWRLKDLVVDQETGDLRRLWPVRSGSLRSD